ncbi:MAG: hypothetical protein WC426_08780 [Sulfuriferula sp.]
MHTNIDITITIDTIKVLAAICSIIGSAILAYRVTGILSALSLVANCHEVNIQQLIPKSKRDMHLMVNSPALVAKAQKKALLITGFIFLIASGVLQLIALVMANA